MPITLHTSRGDLTGGSIPAIVATEWGPGATFGTRADSPRLGQITAPDEHQANARQVLGTVTSATTPDGEVHYEGGDWMDPYWGDPLAGVRSATDRLDVLRAAAADAESAWQESIRAAITNGQRVVDIAAAAGISRERVYQIRDARR